MKVYYIYPDKYDYDEFDGIVVVAENEDRALAMIENGYFRKSYFKDRQGKIHIEEVDLTKEYIVMTSFNAG